MIWVKIHRELDQSSKPLLATTTMGSAQYDDNSLNLNSSLPGVAGDMVDRLNSKGFFLFLFFLLFLFS